MLTLKNSIISLLLTLALGLSCWSMYMSRAPKLLVAATDANLPDTFMEDVNIVILNKEGKPTLKISTPKMIHYAENNTTHMITPYITLFRNSPNPWYINADHAKATRGIDQILFWDNVIIHHPADKENPATQMNTTSLTVIPEKQVATTDEPVTITQPDTTIHATGMLANLDDGTIKLLSKARGEYAPNS